MNELKAISHWTIGRNDTSRIDKPTDDTEVILDNTLRCENTLLLLVIKIVGVVQKYKW